MTFRPTCRQALGRGCYLGGLVGVILGLGLAILVVVGAAGWFGVPRRLFLLLPLVPVLLGTLGGGLFGLLFGRDGGADIDDVGIQGIPRRGGGQADWDRIEDLRAERRGGRTRVAVYVDSGPTGWLRAPYSGRLLATDPEFERKLFMLRNLLATHRSFALTHQPDPPEPG